MRVVELEARRVRIALRRKVTHASHSRTDTDNVVVRCVLADGTVGYGEGVPRAYVTGETIDSCLELLKASDLAAQLAPCTDFVAAVHLAERLKLAPVPGDDRLIRGNAARCALELAVLDAFGRAFGEPLMNVTRAVAPDLYEPRERVRYSGVIGNPKGWKGRGAVRDRGREPRGPAGRVGRCRAGWRWSAGSGRSGAGRTRVRPTTT